MRRLAISLVMLWLVGCADNPSAPIEDRRGVSTKSAPGTTTMAATAKPGKPYTVRRGDTLYGIAFELGMDFRRLAGINGLPAPYTIYPGQILKTSPPANTNPTTSRTGTAAGATPKASSARPATTTVRKGETLYAIARRLGVDPKALAAANGIAPPYTIYPGQVLKTSESDLKRSAAAATPPKKASQSTSAKPAPKNTAAVTKSSPSVVKTPSSAFGSVARWRWPSDGAVVRKYSSNLHKGIDIAGDRGDPVAAVAGGAVVYSGTGLKGYGALVIVKHNEQYLSAYGHNDAILVAEGDTVKVGQTIARMGSSGTDTVKLHFEIRRRGKPVDPLKLLPAR